MVLFGMVGEAIARDCPKWLEDRAIRRQSNNARDDNAMVFLIGKHRAVHVIGCGEESGT
jgi:hypothetical protein